MLRQLGRQCATEHGTTPHQQAIVGPHAPDWRANVARDNTRPQPANQAATSRGVLHPLCGATPVVWCYTRYVVLHPIRTGALLTDRVQCLRIGCTGLAWSGFVDRVF